MKFLFVFFFLLFSFPAFSDVTGTWVFSGSGCRDESLSPESHTSKAPDSDNPVAEAIFTFNRDETAEMEAVFQDGDTQRERGTWRLRGDDLTIPEWKGASMKVIDDTIVIADTGGREQRDYPCGNREVFVYILSSVD